MTTASDLVAYEDDLVAQRIREQPAGSNRTPIGEQFGWNGVAWCAETQSVAVADVFGRRVFWSAAVSEWIRAAKNGINGLAWVEADQPIEAGMLATFDFGRPRGNPAHFHISLVRDHGTQAKFQTDGGNEGDAMRQQWRDRTYVQGFIRLPFDQPAPDQQEDTDVTTVYVIAMTNDNQKPADTARYIGTDNDAVTTCVWVTPEQAITDLLAHYKAHPELYRVIGGDDWRNAPFLMRHLPHVIGDKP